MPRIIVGIDGSDHSEAALGWAVQRSQRDGTEVVAFMAWNTFDQGHHAKGEKLKVGFGDDDALTVVAASVERAGVADSVTIRVREGVPAETLVSEAKRGDIIVIGARGLGGFKGLLLGSVSMRVLELAEVPVVVIQGTTVPAAGGEVVVGVDGSDRSRTALHWAAAEARAAGVGLRLVSAWQVPLYPEVVVPEVYDALQQACEDEAAEMAADPDLTGPDLTGPDLPGLSVVVETPCSNAAIALTAHTDASMIVVGQRGRGAVARALLGSVSHQVVRHAKVPVVVV